MFEKRPVIIVFLVLVLTMACMINVGGPDYPISPIPVSTEALTSMQEQIQKAVSASPETGQITLFITEAQITSFLANKLSTQENPIITQPQVYLQNGQISVFGTAVSGFFKATVSIVLTASINPEGKLILELSTADFGPLPVPEGLKEVITSLVTEAYTGSLGSLATGFHLESIVIANSAMMIIGIIK